ncbi:MAG: hypothetical protein ACOY4I_04780 [Bacillota bacterium]
MFDFTGTKPGQGQNAFDFTTVPATPKNTPERKRPTLDVGNLISKGVFESAVPKEEPPKTNPQPPAPVSDGMGSLRETEASMPVFGNGTIGSRGTNLHDIFRDIGTAAKAGSYNTLTRSIFEKVVPSNNANTLLDVQAEEAKNYQPQTLAEKAAYGVSGLVTDTPIYLLGSEVIGAPIAAGLTKSIPVVETALPAMKAGRIAPGALLGANEANIIGRAVGAYATGAAMGGAHGALKNEAPEQIINRAANEAAMWSGGELGVSALSAGLPVLGRAIKSIGKTETPLIKELNLTKKGVTEVPFTAKPESANSGGRLDFKAATQYEPVKITGNEFGENIPDKELRQVASEYAMKNHRDKVVRNTDTGIDIKIAASGIKHVKSVSGDTRKLKLLVALPEILERSKFVGEELNYKVNQPNIKRILRFRSSAEIGQEPVVVNSVIKESNDGHFFYDYRLSDIEKPAGISRGIEQPGSKPTQPATGSSTIIPPVKEDVKAKPEIAPLEAEDMKALGGWRLYMTDVYRNFKDTFGNQYGKYKTSILDPFDASKKTNIETQEAWLNKLKTEVVDRLGIRKGSKESALVQDFGEGKLPLIELQQMRPKDWQKIVEADQWFRQAYDQLIDDVNASRRMIYPNVEAEMAKIDAKIEAIKKAPKMRDSRKEEQIKELYARKEEIFRNRFVPKRENYYRHFREMAEGWAGLKNIFDSPAQISSSLSGVSEYTLPKSKWASFMQRRGMGSYKSDAVGGFLNYIPAASHAIHIDPHVGKFEKLADDLAEATADTGHLNNFIEYLRDYSRDLAGKTNPFDRHLQKIIPGGRKAFRVIEWLNNRVKANVVLGNASSALAQVANIPQGLAFAKQYSVPGAGRALKSILIESQPMKESGFLKERYGGFGSVMYRQFDTGLLQQPKNFAVWMMETADRIGTTFIWNSAYSKALGLKVADPVKYADNITRKLVAGRGVGEVPLIQKSKIFQLVAPFQLEVGNLWSVMRDFIKEKDFGALVTLAISSWMFNRALEEIRGSGVTFDPIKAMVDAMGEDLTPEQRAGRLAGEVLSNLPLGQTVASIYPEYGAEVFGHKLPTRKNLFGNEDPTRFGSGLLVLKGAQDPLYKIITPFGGNQLKKTLGGIDAVSTKGVYTPDGNRLKYPVSTDVSNIMKGVIFGPGAFREAQDYYKNNNRPLSEKDTELLKARGNHKGQYDAIQHKRDIDSITQQIKDVQKDKKLTQQERVKRVQELTAKRNRLMQSKSASATGG